MGTDVYFLDKFNQFDCSIVIVSTVDMTLTFSFPNVESGGVGGAVTIFRGFRLLRIFKLARSWRSFQVMLVNIRETLKDIGNFFILIGIVIFIYTLVGMELFSYNYDAETSPIPKSRLNFDYFSNALISVFVVLIGEDWDKLMIETMVQDKYPAVPGIFFVSLTIIGNMILLNLFLAILLKNFEDKADKEREVSKDQKKVLPLIGKIKTKFGSIVSKALQKAASFKTLRTFSISPKKSDFPIEFSDKQSRSPAPLPNISKASKLAQSTKLNDIQPLGQSTTEQPEETAVAGGDNKNVEEQKKEDFKKSYSTRL
jgi:hypothetical protein